MDGSRADCPDEHLVDIPSIRQERPWSKVSHCEHMRHMYIRLPRERREIGRDPTELYLAEVHECQGCRLCPQHTLLAG